MHNIYLTQIETVNLTSDFANFNEDELRVILSKPWAEDGKIFSERIWQTYQKDLPNTLMDVMLKATVLGYSTQRVSNMLQERFQRIRRNDIHRLVITEMAQAAEEAYATAYEESGIEQYKYLATLESNTCVVCGHMDGEIFNLSERKPGTNAPLLHPRCRYTTVPYIEGLLKSKSRWMRDPGTGKGRRIDNMSFDDWKKKYSNGSKSGAVNHDWDIKPAYGDHDKSAYKLYEEFTNRKKLPQVRMASKNTGYSVSAISEVFDHVFVNKHYFDNGKYQQFDPDYDMSQSWQHLITNGRNSITNADIIMLEHELYESILMNDGLTYETAHRETDKIYNYRNQLIKEGRVYD